MSKLYLLMILRWSGAKYLIKSIVVRKNWTAAHRASFWASFKEFFVLSPWNLCVQTINGQLWTVPGSVICWLNVLLSPTAICLSQLIVFNVMSLWQCVEFSMSEYIWQRFVRTRLKLHKSSYTMFWLHSEIRGKCMNSWPQLKLLGQSYITVGFNVITVSIREYS